MRPSPSLPQPPSLALALALALALLTFSWSLVFSTSAGCVSTVASAPAATPATKFRAAGSGTALVAVSLLPHSLKRV